MPRPQDEVTVTKTIGVPSVSNVESFEAYSDGDVPDDNWTVENGTVSNARASDGSLAFDNDAVIDTSEVAFLDGEMSGESPDAVSFAYNETTDSGGLAYMIYNSQDELICAVGSANPQVCIEHASGTVRPNDSPTPNYDEWRKFTLEMDWDNNEFSWWWEDLTGSSPTESGGPLAMRWVSSSIGRVTVGHYGFTNGLAAPDGFEWCDELWRVPTTPPILIVDDFETGSYHEDTGLSFTDVYSGDTGSYTITSSPSVDGNSLQRNADDFNASIISTSGLDNYPAQGDEFECYVRSQTAGSQMEATILFGVQDISNGYGVKARVDENTITIAEGTDNDLPVTWSDQNGTTSFTFDADTWYRCRVQWDDGSTFGGSAGDITFIIEEDGNPSNSATHTANSTTHTSGGIGFATDISSHGDVCFFDDYQII